MFTESVAMSPVPVKKANMICELGVRKDDGALITKRQGIKVPRTAPTVFSPRRRGRRALSEGTSHDIGHQRPRHTDPNGVQVRKIFRKEHVEVGADNEGGAIGVGAPNRAATAPKGRGSDNITEIRPALSRIRGDRHPAGLARRRAELF